ncbi:MAG: dienelactone hydrolase family protein [Armatimonadetes bacterium]|nr:dienelactone hydrolase family protein [Armatimonadota bacterium]
MLAAIVSFAVLASGGQDQKAESFTGRVTHNVTTRYLAYVPEGYDQDKKKEWPLVLFLHGAGERGADIQKVKVHGIPKEIAEGRQFPFIAISPQCPTDGWWDTDVLIGLLNHIESKYRVDKSREYLTGISMGGYGTWALAAAQPNRFAAIAPICGGGNPVTAKALAKIPIWCFHGDKDPVVPIQNSQIMVDWVTASKGNIRFTVIKDGQHDVWTDIYKGQEIYDWLLAHRRD